MGLTPLVDEVLPLKQSKRARYPTVPLAGNKTWAKQSKEAKDQDTNTGDDDQANSNSQTQAPKPRKTPTNWNEYVAKKIYRRLLECRLMVKPPVLWTGQPLIKAISGFESQHSNFSEQMKTQTQKKESKKPRVRIRLTRKRCATCGKRSPKPTTAPYYCPNGVCNDAVCDDSWERSKRKAEFLKKIKHQ